MGASLEPAAQEESTESGASSGTGAQQIQELTIMMLGKTGSGKGSLGNVFLKVFHNEENTKRFHICGGMVADSISSASEIIFQIENVKIRLVDSPGVYDNNSVENKGGEMHVLQAIRSSTVKCSDGVDVFFILIRLDVRFTEEESNAIEKLERLFGKTFWEYVVLIFTHADFFDNDEKRCKEQMQTAKNMLPCLKELTKKAKNRAMVVDGSEKAPLTVIEQQTSGILKEVHSMVIKNKARFKNEMMKHDLEVDRLIEEIIQLESKVDRLEKEIKELKSKLGMEDDDESERIESSKKPHLKPIADDLKQKKREVKSQSEKKEKELKDLKRRLRTDCSIL